MFKGAGAMWLSVEAEGGNSGKPQPRECGHQLQKRGAISRIVAVNSHDLHAAGSPRQGSETPSCSGPATNDHGDAGCCVFLSTTGRRQQWRMPNPRRAILRPRPSLWRDMHPRRSQRPEREIMRDV